MPFVSEGDFGVLFPRLYNTRGGLMAITDIPVLCGCLSKTKGALGAPSAGAFDGKGHATVFHGRAVKYRHQATGTASEFQDNVAVH